MIPAIAVKPIPDIRWPLANEVVKFIDDITMFAEPFHHPPPTPTATTIFVHESDSSEPFTLQTALEHLTGFRDELYNIY